MEKNLKLLLIVCVVPLVAALNIGLLLVTIGIYFAIVFIIWQRPSQLTILTQGIDSAGELLKKNNNIPLKVVTSLTTISFIFACWHGGGEPIFTSMFLSFYTDDVQKTQNLILSGVAESNKEIRDKKELLKQFQKQYPLSERKTGESRQDYSEKANNYMTYGLFASNSEVEDALKKATVSNPNPKPTDPKTRIGKSWYPWKVFILYFLTTIVVACITFFKWISAFLLEIIDWLKK